ncbi:hypothetical protein GCM10027346_01740 [Hymenobacter seoulensis]
MNVGAFALHVPDGAQGFYDASKHVLNQLNVKDMLSTEQANRQDEEIDLSGGQQQLLLPPFQCQKPLFSSTFDDDFERV